MKIQLFFLALCLSAILLPAQETITEQSFPDSLGVLPGLSIAFDIQATDDGYVLAGATDFPTGAIRHNLRLLKVDKDLNLVWDTTYWKGNISNLEARAIQILPDESMIVVGFQNHSPIKIRVAANLDTLWTAPFNTQPNTINSSFEAVAITNDGDFLVGGVINSTLSAPSGLLQMITSDNTVLWSRNFQDYSIRDIAVYPDGTFLTAGGHGFMARIAMHKSNGDTIWTQSYSFSKSDIFNDIDILDDGTILFAAEGNGFAGPIPSAGKLKEDGSLLWQASLSTGLGKGTAVEGFGTDSTAVVGSITQFWDFPSPGFVDRVDANGMNIPDSFEQLPEMATASSMILDEGCLVIAGTQNGSFYIQKRCSDSTNDVASPGYEDLIEVFPQPNNGTINIHFPASISLPTAWVLYDNAGKKVKQGSFQSHRETIHIQQLPDGIYWINLRNKNRQLITKKIIKSH